MLPENPVMVGVGVLLILAARLAKSRATLDGKPLRPVTDTERLILFSFGVFALVLGAVRMMHK